AEAAGRRRGAVRAAPRRVRAAESRDRTTRPLERALPSAGDGRLVRGARAEAPNQGGARTPDGGDPRPRDEGARVPPLRGRSRAPRRALATDREARRATGPAVGARSLRALSLCGARAGTMCGVARIMLGVTGGIAAYKACELVRLLVKDGHDVIPIVTRGADRFVRRETFEALARRPRSESRYPHLERADPPVL